MTTINNPKVSITKVSEERDVSVSSQRVLIVGQQTGTVYSSGELIQDIGNSGLEISNIGKGSQLAEMLVGFKTINTETPVDAIALDDNDTGVKATGEIEFTGTATGSGVLTVYIGSRDNHTYTVQVVVGDTAAQVGDKLVSAINADTSKLTTAVNTDGAVALTAVNAGTLGNGIGLQVIGRVAGISTTITAMASGSVDPSLTNLFDVIGDMRYQTIVFPSNLDVEVVAKTAGDLDSLLDPRWNSNNAILDGVCVISKTESLSNLKTFLNSKNSQSLIVHCQKSINETLYKGSSIFELDAVIASKIGAVRALGLTEGADNSNVIVANNADSVGGPHIASLPYTNRSIYLPLIEVGKGWKESEVSDLKSAGGFVIGNNTARTKTVLGEIITTYKYDLNGNTDTTYKFLNSVDIASISAEYIFNNIKSTYSQYRLTDGVVYGNRNITNLDGIRSKLVEFYTVLSGENYMLYRSGNENIQYFVENLTLTMNLSTGSVSGNAKTPNVSQLRALDLKLQSVFNI